MEVFLHPVLKQRRYHFGQSDSHESVIGPGAEADPSR
jgi:hypothetical protein